MPTFLKTRPSLRMLARAIGCFSVLSVSLPGVADATQPLEAFLGSARERNFDARESVALQKQREAEADVSLGLLLPSFTARGTYTRNQYEAAAQLPGGPRILITPKNQLDAFLTLDIPIIDVSGFHRYGASKALARAARYEKEAVQLNADSAVSRAYYLFIGSSALVQSARQSVAVAEDNLRNVEVRFEAGASTELDRSRALANAERARQDLADAELMVALAARDLSTLSGLAPTPAETFPEDDLREEASLNQWLSRAGHTPRDLAAKEVTAAVDQNRKAAKAALLPVLSGSAQERFTNATGFAGNSAIYTLQLAATWRFDLTVPANIRAQTAAAELQGVREERAQRGVADAIFAAHSRVVTGLAKSRAARVQAEAAQKASDLASERYKAGAATQLDVTQAQRDAFQAQAARIQADADLVYSRVALRLAAGLPASHQGSP